MNEINIYDTSSGRRLEVIFGHEGISMPIDKWEQLCNLILFEIRRDRALQQSAQQAVAADRTAADDDTPADGGE